MSHKRETSTASLEPPKLSIEDPGARDLDSSDGDEHFSDASEGKVISRPATPASPIPRTRVELADDRPSHGQIPGSPAYEQRLQDSVPDEVEVVPEGKLSKQNSQLSLNRNASPIESPIPKTVVEKIDPAETAYGDEPGTEAYAKRNADAAPDLIVKVSDSGQRTFDLDGGSTSPRPDIPIPATVITRVDSMPAHGEEEGTDDNDIRQQDVEPEKAEVKRNPAGLPTLDRSLAFKTHARRKSSLRLDDEDAEVGFGDDFDEFEEGAQAGEDDDFGDFGDDFEEADEDDDLPEERATQESPEPPFPLIDVQTLTSLREILEATKGHLDAMFPDTTAEKLESLPVPQAIPADSPIFTSERSRSLWKQLVTPPPLQPPNWTKSRIRRLFLVSLGVPVDLDEILPPSKQKKLVLPDINLGFPTRKSESDKALGSITRLKAQEGNDSRTSMDSAQSQSKTKSRKLRGPAPPPELDLTAVRRICATTNEKLDGFDDAELRDHVAELEALIEKTKELLEYWLKSRDGARKEKEAFEGVIENLVRHARRVRK